jgi:hypothetical protein
MKRPKLGKVWGTTAREAKGVYQVRMAQWFAGLKGYTIDKGSWIRGPITGKPVAQGWIGFYEKYRAAIVELVWGVSK